MSGGETFTRAEWRLLRQLDAPRKVQRWLEALPYNHEEKAETLRTFRTVARLGTAHCLEAALAAATILEAHGYPPLLLDLESQDDLDHVVFLFRANGRYGSVAKSRDPGLHGRKPVFRTIRGLVMSYVDPYVDFTGRITGYGVFDLRTLGGVDWRRSRRHVWAVERALIRMPHTKLVTSDRRYRRFLERFRAFKAKYPDRRPLYFTNRHQWL